MSKRPSLTSQFQKLDQIRQRPESSLGAPTSSADDNQSATAASPLTASAKANTGESLSTVDTIQNEQCASRTVSTADTFHGEQSLANASSAETVSKSDTIHAEHSCGSASTVAITDTVQTEHCPKRTVSTSNTPPALSRPSTGATGRLQGNFTQVPNSLLRTPGLFEDPFDFMIYLLLYSYSYGYGRKTADMSQSQIEQFAGVSKNRVKRSLERLVSQRWIKLVQEYERARVPRKWLVTAPEDWKPRGGKERSPATRVAHPTVSDLDTVRDAQCPPQPQGVSAVNTLTLSKTDSYKESIQTKLQIHSLSAIPNEIREYLDGIRPQRKRKSELRAFQELSKEYSSEDIAECLKHVLREGLPGGESCHSPLAFLAVGMDEVLRAVTETLEKCRLQREREDRKAIEIMCEQEQIEQERRELERQERAFSQAFHAVDRQAEVIRELCCRHGFPTSTGAAARAFAIGVWSRGWQKAEMAG